MFMKLLAVDFGEKNIGLAFCDLETRVPVSLEPLRVNSEKEALEKIAELVKQRNIDIVIFGLPLTFHFEETEASEKIRVFSEKLVKNIEVKIEFVNEVLSSELAQKLKQSSRASHSSSALVILDDYLTQR